MENDDFLKCNIFNDTADILSGMFSFQQSQLLYTGKISNKPEFSVVNVNYSCKLTTNESIFNNKVPLIIIPSRDNIDIISYTVNNLISHGVDRLCNILVVDDRSTDDYTPLLDLNISLLRVDNESGFNFSMLCNIGAHVANKLGYSEIILWNNDLWVQDIESLEKIIEKHRLDTSTISGAKLIYPSNPVLNENDDTDNINTHFPHMKNGKWRGTVQFGGDSWVYTHRDAPIVHSPIHFKRFTNPLNPLVNCNRGATFVTGAFQLYNLKWFVENGGLNPSLPKLFQDVDICLRAVEQNTPVMYYGKNIHFIHDESVTFYTLDEKKTDIQSVGDHLLFGSLWNEKIPNIIF